MSLRIRLTITFVMLVIIPVFLVGSVSIGNASRLSLEQVGQHMDSLASSKVATIEEFITSQENIYHAIASRTKLRNTLISYNATGAAEDVSTMETILRDAQEPFSDLKWLLILAPDGQPVAQTDIVSTDEFRRMDEFLALGAISPQLFFDHIGKNLIMLGPIVKNGELLGLLAFETNNQAIIRLVSDYKGLGETGEVILAQRDEFGNALFLHERRFESTEEGIKTVNKNAFNIPIRQALLQQEDVFFDQVDYRGIPVVAATRYIPATDWGLVVKIDQSELLEQLDGFQTTLTFFVLLIIIVTGVISYAIALSILRPIQLLTRSSEQMAVGDFSASVDAEVLDQSDEIGVLGRVMENMGKSLMGMYTELEKKVLDRTRSLDTKIEELEQLNDLMLGREEKMIELKQELEALRNKQSDD